MKRLIIGITVLVACHVGNVEAAQWMPLDEAEDRQLIRTNQSPEEGHIICTSKTRGNGQGIAKDGRRLGFLTKKGCKTIGGGDKVRWFKRENGDLMVLVDDEPAVQDDAQNEGEDYQARYEEARDAAAKAVQQLQDAQEREANLQEQHDAALQGKIDAALEGMVTADDVERREESLQARHDSLISSNIHAALEGMVSEADVQGQIETALVGMVAEADVDRRVEAALVGLSAVYDEALKGMVAEEDVQGQIETALVGMVAEADVTPLNCSEGTAVNAAGDACEPTAEYRAAAVEEGRLAGVASATPCPVTWHMDDGIMPSSIQHPGGHDENGYCLGKYLRVVSDVSEIKGYDLSTGEVYDIICRPADVAAACGKIGSRPGYGCKE